MTFGRTCIHLIFTSTSCWACMADGDHNYGSTPFWCVRLLMFTWLMWPAISCIGERGHFPVSPPLPPHPQWRDMPTQYNFVVVSCDTKAAIFVRGTPFKTSGWKGTSMQNGYGWEDRGYLRELLLNQLWYLKLDVLLTSGSTKDMNSSTNSVVVPQDVCKWSHTE